MRTPYYREQALEGIAREVITAYDPNLYYGVPRMIPIEDIIEAQGITLEYQCLRKTGCVLGETIFDDAAPLSMITISQDIPSLRSRAAPYSSIAPSAERTPPQAGCALPVLMNWHTGCCIRKSTAEPVRARL